MRIAFLFAALSLLCGLSLGCDPPAECQGSDISYIKCIRPTLTANCAGGGCHGGDNPEWGLQLEKHGEIYNSILPHINTSDPTGSKLLNQMMPNPKSGRRMPVDERPWLSEAQLKMFETWIKEGAKNDDPDYKPTGTDKPQKPEIPDGIVNVSYKTTILPLMQQKCATAGCHDDQTKSANLDLTDVRTNTIDKKSNNQAYNLITAGKPLESLMLIKLLEKRPANAGSRMPIGTPFTKEEIAQMYIWIEEGAKDN